MVMRGFFHAGADGVEIIGSDREAGRESAHGFDLRGQHERVVFENVAALQLRADMFNAFNRAGITGRNTTLQLNSPADPSTNVQPAFDPVTGLLNDGVNLTSTGAVSPNRSQSPRIAPHAHDAPT